MAGKIMEEDIEAIAKDIAKEAEVLSGKTLLITGGAGFHDFACHLVSN